MIEVATGTTATKANRFWAFRIAPQVVANPLKTSVTAAEVDAFKKGIAS